MPFCSNCGAKLYDGASFCSECGVPVSTVQQQNNNTTDSRQQAQKFQSAVDRAADSVLAGIKKVADGTKQIFEAENTKKAPDTPGDKTQQEQTPPQVPHSDYTQRQQEYSGKLIKCPNCGEVLSSFTVNCPVCGYEIREVKASSAVKEFALKLEAIEAKREYEKPRGLLATSYALQRISKTDEQKISLIKSFSVPNSKEDMLEFMILASSSINMSGYDSANSNISKSQKELNAAWLSKVQQVFEKAKRSNFADDTFLEIEEIYNKCHENISKSKKKGIIKWFLMLGSLLLPLIVVIVSLCVSEPKEESKEIERLENIVIEVQEALENGEYKLALRIADSIDYQRYDIEMERKWDIQRGYWVDKVIEKAAEDGVVLEYIPSEDIDKANDKPTKTTSTEGFVGGFKDGVESGLNK